MWHKIAHWFGGWWGWTAEVSKIGDETWIICSICGKKCFRIWPR